MIKRNLKELLEDILEAIDDIETFTKTLTLEQFSGNKEKILAVIKSIEIIGEAVKLIPQEIRDKNPQVPWKAIAGMRDMLVHEYWGIDINVVW
ncbi:MAG: DUF86 domain-containing protein [Xenococcaceae cyanobacterium MO_188.B19]|nr:DUF86 domain-containing protein [Xenococcaceae cyanobacterium MO_188.B19]